MQEQPWLQRKRAELGDSAAVYRAAVSGSLPEAQLLLELYAAKGRRPVPSSAPEQASSSIPAEEQSEQQQQMQSQPAEQEAVQQQQQPDQRRQQPPLLPPVLERAGSSRPHLSPPRQQHRPLQQQQPQPQKLVTSLDRADRSSSRPALLSPPPPPLPGSDGPERPRHSAAAAATTARPWLDWAEGLLQGGNPAAGWGRLPRPPQAEASRKRSLPLQLGCTPPGAPRMARSGSLPLLQHLQQRQQQHEQQHWQALQRSQSGAVAAKLQVLSPPLDPGPSPLPLQERKQPCKQRKLHRVPSASSQGPSPAAVAAACHQADYARLAQPLEQLLQRQRVAAMHRAQELAQQRPLAAGLAGGAAFLGLRPAAGSALEWGMHHLCCPPDASVAAIAQAVAAGLAQQHGLPAAHLKVKLLLPTPPPPPLPAPLPEAIASLRGGQEVQGPSGKQLSDGTSIRELLPAALPPLQPQPGQDIALEYSVTVAAPAGASTPAAGAAEKEEPVAAGGADPPPVPALQPQAAGQLPQLGPGPVGPPQGQQQACYAAALEEEDEEGAEDRVLGPAPAGVAAVEQQLPVQGMRRRPLRWRLTQRQGGCLTVGQ